jgi:hypothetical protein
MLIANCEMGKPVLGDIGVNPGAHSVPWESVGSTATRLWKSAQGFNPDFMSPVTATLKGCQIELGT